MAVEDVGTGVGYLRSSVKTSRLRLSGRGRTGEEESGSKAGNSEAGGFLLLESGDGSLASRPVLASMMCGPKGGNSRARCRLCEGTRSGRVLKQLQLFCTLNRQQYQTATERQS